MKKPKIAILATGGTIAGSSINAANQSYTAATLNAAELVKSIPELETLATLTTEQLFSIGSQNMTPAHWLTLARRVSALAKDENIDGVVITHGTDTLEESAYFLNLVVRTKKPVVFVGAMRNATSLSADGALNLYNAVSVAAHKNSQEMGVLVVMNDEIHAAREAKKTKTTSVESFTSCVRLGSVIYGDVRFYAKSLRRHTFESEFDICGLDVLPRVDIVLNYAGFDAKMIDWCVKSGAKGIVNGGVGNANTSTEGLEALANAVKSGVVVVRGSRVGSGLVTSRGEVDDSKFGFTSSDNLTLSKARVLLSLALTKTSDIKEIRRIFGEY